MTTLAILFGAGLILYGAWILGPGIVMIMIGMILIDKASKSDNP